MQVQTFIASLEKMNFSLSVKEGKLILKGDRKKLSKEEIEAIKINEDVINYIKSHKEELIEYISALSDISVAKNAKDIVSVYRLSGLQQGMLFHGLYDNAGSYIEQLRCDLIGVNRESLLSSWSAVIKHHSILRSAFYYNSFSVPVQCVYRQVDMPVEELDYRGMDGAELASALEKYATADRAKGFDFKSAPLMRLCLIRQSEDRYRMLWTSHHLLFDGWSMPVLMEELLNTYDLLLSGQAVPQAEEDRYEDYIRYLEWRDKDAEEEYWRNYLRGISQGTLLPFIQTTAERTKGRGTYRSLSLDLGSAATARIQEYAQSFRLTVNTLMQGIWALLLHKYTGDREVVYGVVVSGRPDELPQVEQRVGMYINTLALRAVIDLDQEVAGWLQGLQADQVSSRQYQYTALQDVQGWTGIKGDLFDSILVFENYPVSKLIRSTLWSLQVENIALAEQTNYPLTVTISSSEQIGITFIYNADLLEQAYVTAVRDQFDQVLRQITDGQADTLNDIRILTKEQEHTLLIDFNATETAYPKNKSIVDLFEDQVVKTPESIAVIFEEEQLTYKELNTRSNQLARYLRSKGVKAEMLVPICLERSLEMVVGILGILKAGGAYIPIDPEYPQDRISYMLEDTRAKLILTTRASREKLPGTVSASVIELDADWEHIRKEKDSNAGIIIHPEQLAYLIYTSGSTGKPKGVMIEHLNVVSLVKGVDYVALSEEDTLLVTGSPSFDATTFEYWGMLLNGGRLILTEVAELLEIASLKAAISSNEVSIMWFTSSWFNQLADRDPKVFAGLKTIIVGGEKLSEYHIEKIRAQFPELKLINGYGPTENTTFSLTYPISDNTARNPIPIGRPLNNRKAYVLTEFGKLNPVGVFGEIWIGGAGLARGYLNQPELTAERFIKDPFSKEAGARLYRTGDLGRWVADGNMEYLGRIDDQVKIRGYRIELGEIESVLNQSGLVQQGVVQAKEDNGGNKRLVGYTVPQGTFDKQAIQSYLGAKLPGYMVPTLWVTLDSIPLTPNGKIDRKALPDPEINDMTVEYVAPRNETEAALASIWQELLNVERVGIYDNFFELGGHSLLAMRAVSYIERDLSVSIPIHMLFQFASINDLGKYLEIQSKGNYKERNTGAFKVLDV